MNKYSRLFLIGVLSMTLLSACADKESTKISTIDDNSKDVTVVDINESENTEKHNKISSYYLNEKTEEYNFSSNILENDKYKIVYPVLSNYKGQLNMDYINQTIEDHAKNLIANTSDVNPGSKLTYVSEVVSQNDKFISIKFTGELPYEGSSYKFISGLVIDLYTTNTITFENLFADDRSILNKEFEKAAKEIDTITFLPADYMIMYIEGKNLVFAYMENDISTEFTEIKIPLESIIDNLNIDFGQRPAS